MPSTPCLLAVYADWCGCGRNEFVDAMLTIAPPAALLQHLADLVLHAQEDRSQVDGDDPVERLLFDVGQRHPLELDGCAVDGAVQAAERLDRAADEVLDGARVGDVGGEELGLAAGIVDHLARSRCRPPRRGRRPSTLAPAAANAEGGRPAHAAGRAGHQRHLAGEASWSLIATPRFLIASLQLTIL